ncbi:MAG: glycosyltransferase family 39 protein [Acidobacteriota bacterium]
MKLSQHILLIRRWLSRMLATRETLSRKQKLIIALLIFLVAFSIRSLHAVDLAPVMYSAEQPFGGLTETYDARAVGILEGEGLIGPYDINPRRTVWIAQAPGYSVFLSAVYKVTGRDFYKAQLFQNLINSISPVLIFFIAGMLISWRVGIIAGFISAISHHLAHISNFMLPDPLSAFPVLVAFLLLILARRAPDKLWRVYLLYAAAGLMFGVAAWVRSQTMLLGIFLIPGLVIFAKQKLVMGKRALVTAAVSLLVIAPITIKNYLIYHEFVPVNFGAGIVLWEGIGEESGDRFGAVTKDEEVALQDAEFYNEPRYAGVWSTPDGIMRDRDRVTRSLAIIKAHPIWYAGVMFRRANEMVEYKAHAPLVYKISEARALEKTLPVKKTWDNLAANSGESSLIIGKNLLYLRPVARSLQRIIKEPMRWLIFIGAVALMLLSVRRAWWLLLVPLYYFIFQGFMHTEFRYTLPMQYFAFTFAAVSWVLLAGLLTQATRTIIKKFKSS